MTRSEMMTVSLLLVVAHLLLIFCYLHFLAYARAGIVTASRRIAVVLGSAAGILIVADVFWALSFA